LALEILAELNAAKASAQGGWSAAALATRLRVEPGEMQEMLAVLQQLDWVGLLAEQTDPAQARQVLLIDLTQVGVGPLVDRLLVLRTSKDDPLWVQTGLEQLRVSQLLPPVLVD
jgi:membrane protein